jgi:hypothetical protein
MAHRTGEKVGWIGGWIGAFLWVVVLSIVFLIQGKATAGVAGVALVALAAALVWRFAPWRHPKTACWKLLLAPYLAAAASVVWAALAFGVDGLRAEGLSPWSFGILVPMLLPFLNGGRRRWIDGER